MNPQRVQISQNPNSPGRRELLWNVSEPGDPYDIKRSMIGKMPGDKKIFMGQHLELVCLLQAAQIERLCEFLEDYKLRFREIQRINLDRHSYQVQIKELTHRIAEEESSKGESSKLIQFIKKQQAQIQYLQGLSRDSSASADGIRTGYQQLLEQSNQLKTENQQFRRQSEQYKSQFLNLRAQYEALERSKNRQIQDLKFNLSKSSKQSIQSSINNIKLQYEGELRKCDLEIKRLKQLNDAKNSEINELMSQRQELAQKLAASQGNADAQRQLIQYQNKFVLFGQEIERLNIALRDYTNKLEESDLKRRELERAMDRSQFEKRQMDSKLKSNSNQISHLNQVLRRYEVDSRKLGQSQQQKSQYEQQILTLQKQIGELNIKIRQESEQSRRFKTEVEQLSYDNSKYKVIQKENAELRIRIEEFAAFQRKTAQYQNQIALLNQEILRLKEVIHAKDNQLERTRVVVIENESNKSKVKELESIIVNKYEFEISRLKADFDQKIDQLNRSKGTQIQGKSRLYQTQIDKLRQSIMIKSSDEDRLKSRIHELQTMASRNELEISNKFKSYENNLANLRRENQDLFNKVRVASENERKVRQLESRLVQNQRQFQRLTISVKKKEEEIINLRNRLRQTQGTGHRLEHDYGQKMVVLEQTLTTFRTENDELKRRMTELANDTNRKLNEASQELDRLGKQLNRLSQQKSQLQMSLRQLSQESAADKQHINKLNAEREDLLRRMGELQKQLGESRLVISRYEVEVKKVNRSMEESLTTVGRQNEATKKMLSDYEAKLSLLSQQLDRLNSMLRTKSQEYNILQSNYQKLSVEHENTKKQFRDYEISVKNKFQGQINQKIMKLTQENDDLKRKLTELQGKYRQLYQESNRELQSLKRQLSQREGSFELQINKKVTVYETNITNITRQNEELVHKLRQCQNYARQKSEECNRLDNLLKNSQNELEKLKRQWRESELLINKKYETQLHNRETQYQQTVRKLNLDNDQLRRKLQQYGGDVSRKINQYQTRLSQLTQENQRFKTTITMLTQDNDKYKININMLTQENDVLKQKIEGYENTINNYQRQIKHRFETYQHTITTLRRESDQHSRRQQEFRQLSRKLSQYQSRIAILSQEIERLHGNFNQISQENDKLKKQLHQKTNTNSHIELQFNRKVVIFEQNIEGLQNENKEYKKRIVQYQQRLHGMSQLLQRVNLQYRSKMNEYLTVEQIMAQIKRDNEDLNKKVKESHTDFTTKYAQLQNRVALMSQQIERLNLNIRTKQEELNRLQQLNRSQNGELQTWRKKYNELQGHFNQTMQIQVNQKFTTYEQTISQLKVQNKEFENKLLGLMQEIERLNNILRLKVDQSVTLTNNINLLSNQHEALKQKYLSLENELSHSKSNEGRQKEDLRRQLQQMELYWKQRSGSYEQNIADYQNKLRITSQEMERLNQIIKTKTGQLQIVRKQFKDYQDSVALEMKGNYGQYQTKITTLQRQNQQYRRNFTQIEKKLLIASQQIERLNGLLRKKSEQINKYEFTVTNLTREHEEVRRKWQETNDVNRRIPEFEQKIAQMFIDNQTLQTTLNSKTEQINSSNTTLKKYQIDMETLKKRLADYEVNMNGKINGYEQGIAQLRRQNEELIRKRAEYQNKIAMLSQELERANGALSSKSDLFIKLTQEFQTFKRSRHTELEENYKVLHQNYTIVTNEYELAKKHLIEYQESIRKLHAQFERLQNILNQLKKERDGLIQKNRFLGEQIQRLTGVNSDLEQQTKEVRLRLSDETALQKRISEHLSLMVILFAEIQTLRNRVKDKEKEVVEVRKSSLAPHLV